MTCMKEIREHSPLRVLDRSIHGGLGPGDLGVVCSGAGAGKTAFLVGLALDVLMRGCQVLHIAIEQSVDRVRNYYDELLAEIARVEHLEKPAEVRLTIEKNRRIHVYQDRTFSLDSLERTLMFLRAHTDLHPDLILIDGFDWQRDATDDLIRLRKLAADQGAQLWMSATISRAPGAESSESLPAPLGRFASLVDVVLRLKGADGTVHLTLLKDRENVTPEPIALDLDPTTLLLVKR